MPIKATLKFLAWSYSRLHDYEDCAAKAKLKYLDKLAEPGSPAMARGSAMHKTAEAYAIGRMPVKPLPEELARFPEEFAHLRKIAKHLHTEQQLAMNAKWQPCDWFGKDAWVRVVLDCYYLSPDGDQAKVIDHKSGKARKENLDQLDLYAIAIFVKHPSVDEVEAALWYLDQGEVADRKYKRADLPKLKKVWEKRTAKMLADVTFKPNPGNACRWCPYTDAKGGPCEF